MDNLKLGQKWRVEKKVNPKDPISLTNLNIIKKLA